MSEEDVGQRTISLKERARLARKAAYQRAKEARKNDPRILAMKEAAKAKRKAIHQEAKEKRKAERKVEKQQDARKRTEDREASRKESYGALMKLVKRGNSEAAAEPFRPEPPPAANDGPSMPGLRLIASNTPRREGAGKRPSLRLVEPDAED